MPRGGVGVFASLAVSSCQSQALFQRIRPRQFPQRFVWMSLETQIPWLCAQARVHVHNHLCTELQQRWIFLRCHLEIHLCMDDGWRLGPLMWGNCIFKWYLQIDFNGLGSCSCSCFCSLRLPRCCLQGLEGQSEILLYLSQFLFWQISVLYICQEVSVLGCSSLFHFLPWAWRDSPSTQERPVCSP